MDPTVMNPWIVLVVGLLGLGTTIWNIFSQPGAKAQAAVAKLTERVERSEAKVSVLETNMMHIPDRDAFHRLDVTLAKLEGRFDTLDERLKPVAAMANRFQDYMLTQGH